MRLRAGPPERSDPDRDDALLRYSGKVTDTSGVPVENAVIEVFQRFPAGEAHSGRGRRYEEGGYQYLWQCSAWANDLGEYRMTPLPAGSYYAAVYPAINARPRDDRERTTFYPRVLKISEAKPVEVAEGDEVHLDLLLIRQGGVKAGGRIIGLPPEGAGAILLCWRGPCPQATGGRAHQAAPPAIISKSRTFCRAGMSSK